MIDHLSLSALDPRHIANILAEIWNERAYISTPHPESYSSSRRSKSEFSL